MQVWRIRQSAGIDLRDWSDEHELPTRRLRRYRREQFAVQALIKHAKESDSRLRDRRWSGGSPWICRAEAKCSTSTPLGNSCTLGCKRRFEE